MAYALTEMARRLSPARKVLWSTHLWPVKSGQLKVVNSYLAAPISLLELRAPRRKFQGAQQGVLSLATEIPECHFCCILSVKKITKTSSDSSRGKMNPTSQWKE